MDTTYLTLPFSRQAFLLSRPTGRSLWRWRLLPSRAASGDGYGAGQVGVHVQNVESSGNGKWMTRGTILGESLLPSPVDLSDEPL